MHSNHGYILLLITFGFGDDFQSPSRLGCQVIILKPCQWVVVGILLGVCHAPCMLHTPCRLTTSFVDFEWRVYPYIIDTEKGSIPTHLPIIFQWQSTVVVPVVPFLSHVCMYILYIIELVLILKMYELFAAERLTTKYVWPHKTSLTRSFFIEVPVPNKESEWSCICVLGVSILPLSTSIFL